MPYREIPDPGHPMADDDDREPVRRPIACPDGTAYVDPREIVYVSPSVVIAPDPKNPDAKIRVRVCFFRGGPMFNALDSPDNRKILGIPAS